MKGKAEVYFRNQYGSQEVLLLGEDGLLYDYNNVWHHAQPYSQDLRKRVNLPREEVERILSKSVIYHENGTIEDRINGVLYKDGEDKNPTKNSGGVL